MRYVLVHTTAKHIYSPTQYLSVISICTRVEPQLNPLLKGQAVIISAPCIKATVGRVFHFQPTIFSSSQVIAVFDGADTLLCASLKDPCRCVVYIVQTYVG